MLAKSFKKDLGQRPQDKTFDFQSLVLSGKYEEAKILYKKYSSQIDLNQSISSLNMNLLLFLSHFTHNDRIYEFLLENGADPNIIFDDNKTVFSLVMDRKDQNKIALLKKYNAIDYRLLRFCKILKSKDTQEEKLNNFKKLLAITPNQELLALFKILLSNAHEINNEIRKIIEKKIKIHTDNENFNFYPANKYLEDLKRYVETNDVEAISNLSKLHMHDRFDIFIKVEAINAIINLAIKKNHTKIAQKLLTLRRDFSYSLGIDLCESSSLIEAFKKQNIEIINEIILHDTYDVDYIDKTGLSPISFALILGDSDVLQKISAKNPDFSTNSIYGSPKQLADSLGVYLNSQSELTGLRSSEIFSFQSFVSPFLPKDSPEVLTSCESNIFDRLSRISLAGTRGDTIMQKLKINVVSAKRISPIGLATGAALALGGALLTGKAMASWQERLIESKEDDFLKCER